MEKVVQINTIIINPIQRQN